MSAGRSPHESREPSLVIDYRSPEGVNVRAVRSTLIASSLTTLRELGHYERYLKLLPAEFHDRILLTIAPEWLPIEVGEAHYGTCDQLGLSERDLEHIGELVSARIMGTFLGTLVRGGSRNVGATPWIPLGKYDFLWSRLMLGGTCSVERVGPKDAIVRAQGASMFATQYFRVAYNGVVRGATGMFSRNVVGRTTRALDVGPHAVVTKLSWV